MRKILTSAVILVALAGTARARVTVGFDFGNVGVGYSDGYRDNANHWHKWRRHDDMVRFQHDHADQYHEWRHNDARHY